MLSSTASFAGVLQLLAQQQSAELRHRFDDQHARHDRRAGIMALEENVVERHVLDPGRLVSPTISSTRSTISMGYRCGSIRWIRRISIAASR